MVPVKYAVCVCAMFSFNAPVKPEPFIAIAPDCEVEFAAEKLPLVYIAMFVTLNSPVAFALIPAVLSSVPPLVEAIFPDGVYS